MKLIIIAGAPRQGKSRFAKRLITLPETRHLPCYVFDVQNEYGDFYTTDINGQLVEVPGPGLPANQPHLARSRYASGEMDMGEFLEVARRKKNTNLIFEESTGFLKGNTSPLLRQMINGRFHTHNTFIFNFHTLRTVPPDIMGMANTVILFKTLDNVKFIESKFGDFGNGRLTAALRKQQAKPNKSAPEYIELL